MGTMGNRQYESVVKNLLASNDTAPANQGTGDEHWRQMLADADASLARKRQVIAKWEAVAKDLQEQLAAARAELHALRTRPSE
jgi:hypothetical protein